MRVECGLYHRFLRWISSTKEQSTKISDGICPECAWRKYGMAGCGCPEHADKCHHCWSWEEVETDSYDDGAETYIVTTCKCLTCGELFDRERAMDSHERRDLMFEHRLDAAEARAETKREERD